MLKAFGLGLWTGLTRASGLAVTVLLGVLLLLGVLALRLEPQQVAALLERFPGVAYSKQGADYALLRLYGSTAPPTGGVLLLGSSTVWCLLSSEQDLAQRLGPGVSVLDLSTSGQTVWETLAYLEHALPRAAPSLVVIGVNVSRLVGRGMDDPALITPSYIRQHQFALSPTQEQLLADLPGYVPATGRYVLDQQAFLRQQVWPTIKTSLRQLRTKTIELSYSPITGRRPATMPPPIPPASLALRKQRIHAGLLNYDRHWALFIRPLQRAIALAQQAGARVLLLETPMQPQVRAAEGALYQRHLASMQQLAARYKDVHFVDLNPLAPLQDGQFTDAVHIYDSSTTQYVTAALAQALRPYFPPAP